MATVADESVPDDVATARTEPLTKVVDWLSTRLAEMPLGDEESDETAEDDAFVQMGRSLLHTKAAEVSYASTVQEMHLGLWAFVEGCNYFADGSGGGALFVTPKFTNFEGFDDFSLLVRSGLRAFVDPQLRLEAYHPLHPSPSRRSPLPAIHLFLDSESLFTFD